MEKAQLIKANGEVTEITPKNNTDFSLEELQEYVGGWIEFVPMPNGIILVVNEEGKLDGLPHNEKATQVFKYDEIVGDAVLTPRKLIK
jgi:hypothetical protein